MDLLNNWAAQLGAVGILGFTFIMIVRWMLKNLSDQLKTNTAALKDLAEGQTKAMANLTLMVIETQKQLMAHDFATYRDFSGNPERLDEMVKDRYKNILQSLDQLKQYIMNGRGGHD